MTEDNKTPWKDGFWYSESNTQLISKVEGNKASYHKHTIFDFPDCKPAIIGTWTFGEFEDAKPEVAEASGQQKCNLEMDFQMMKIYGVLCESGTKVYYWGFSNKMEESHLMNEDDINKIKENRDPLDALPNPYCTSQPDKLGKAFWFSGIIHYYISSK